MDRAERRKRIFEGRRATTFDVRQVAVEEATRGRLARRLRGHLRRLEPVAMLTPRWSAPQGFLEDLALDLAVGEPEIGCRTVSFRPLMGRSPAEAWNFLLRVFGELGSPEWGSQPVPMVCDRRGFLYAAEELLDTAQDEAPYPIALLGHGVEHLPVEVLDDVTQVWTRFQERYASDRRCTMLLAGSVDTPALDVGGAVRIDLEDFGEAEAAASLVLQLGQVDPAEIERAARFSGGVPAIVQAIAGSCAAGFPTSPGECLRTLGPLAAELRGAVHSAQMMPDGAERLHALMNGEPQLEEPEVDEALIRAGIVRRVRQVGGVYVALRSPAIAAVAG